MRRLIPAAAGLLLALALPTIASAHEITNVQVDCDGHAIHVSGKLFGQDAATVTVTGPGGYSESFVADQDAEWTVTVPLGPDGAYVIDWPESGTFGPVDFAVDCEPAPTATPSEEPTATPTETPSEQPTATATVAPTATPSETPSQAEISVAAVQCGEPTDTPHIRILGLVVGWHLLIDGIEVRADANRLVAVAAGMHHWAVRNQTQVLLASGDIQVEACGTAATEAPNPTATSTPVGNALGAEGSAPPNTGAVEAAVGSSSGGAAPTPPPTDVAGVVDQDAPAAPTTGLVVVGLAAASALLALMAAKRGPTRHDRSR